MLLSFNPGDVFGYFIGFNVDGEAMIVRQSGRGLKTVRSWTRLIEIDDAEYTHPCANCFSLLVDHANGRCLYAPTKYEAIKKVDRNDGSHTEEQQHAKKEI